MTELECARKEMDMAWNHWQNADPLFEESAYFFWKSCQARVEAIINEQRRETDEPESDIVWSRDRWIAWLRGNISKKQPERA